ncbi:response regulator [soil metagenome]
MLVVDDNALNVELVGYVLEHDEFTIASCADAECALTEIGIFKPDLILMDIQLPGLNGMELSAHLKSDERYRHIIIVAFTAYAMKGDEAKFMAAGCDGYITKPIDVASFAASLRAFLAKGAR